jgi:hypothetical protein
MKKIRTIYLIALCAAMILGVFFSIKQKEKTPELSRYELAEEADAYKLIEEEYGIKPLKFGYLPDGLMFENVELHAEKEYAVLKYVGEDSKWVELYVIDPHRSDFAADVVEINGEIQSSYRIEANDVSVQVDQYKNSDSEKTMMHSLLIKDKVRNTLLSHNIAPVEYDKIVGNLVFVQ